MARFNLAIVKLSHIYSLFCVVFRTPADPSSALQRSRSSFQLDEPRERDSSKDFPLRQDIQEMLGPMQDTSFNRSESSTSKSFSRSESSRSESFSKSESSNKLESFNR